MCASVCCPQSWSNFLRPQGLQTTRLLCPWILQTRILEQFAISSSRWSAIPSRDLQSQTRDWICSLLNWQAGSLPLSHLCSPLKWILLGKYLDTINFLGYTLQKQKQTNKQLWFSSVTQSCPTLWPHGLQHAWLPCPSPATRACSNSCPSTQWCHPTISSSVVSFASCLKSFPAPGLFQWVSSLHQVAKVLELQLQYQPFQWIFRNDFLSDGLLGSPCSPRDSQESSPTPQLKSINSLVLSFLYSPTLTSIHDYWKSHSFD